METRHPVEGSFGCEFRRSIIVQSYGGLKSQELEKSVHFWRFLKNDPLRGNLQNSVLKEFTALPIHVLCANFVKFGRLEIGEIVRCLKPNSITLSGRRQVRSWSQTCSELEFGLSSSSLAAS